MTASLDGLFIHQPELFADIEYCGTFSGGSKGDSIEACFVLATKLSRTFGYVERDRNGGSVELLSERGVASWEAVDQLGCHADELESSLIYVQSFVIEIPLGDAFFGSGIGNGIGIGILIGENLSDPDRYALGY